MVGPLSGKVALVTGASRGIGAACATSLAEAGARVALLARSGDELQRLAARLPGGALTRVLDVTRADEVDRVVDAVAREGSGLHIVVNAAGISERKPASQGDDTWWDRMLSVNLSGTFHVCRAALRHLGSGGRIVNIASVLGVFGIGDSAGYVAAKHGVVGLTRALADEVAALGITVNAVCPGWVETEMAERGFLHIAGKAGITPEEARRRALSQVPTGRIVHPEEVASLVTFLCLPEASAVHAQAIRIDGGATPW